MYAAFVKLLNMSAASAILIAVVIALRFLMRKVPKKYICVLWAIVALRLICPISISSAVSAYNYIGHQEAGSGQVEYIHYNGKSEKPKAEVTITIPIESEKNDGPTVAIETKGVYIPTLIVFWATGFAAMVLYAAFSYRRVRIQVRESIPLDSGNYRRDIFVCDHIPSPFILGVLKPKIYLPSVLDREQQRSVVAHERAHIARLDHWWKPLGFLLLSMHWFNPMVWVAYALLCRDIEMACDEKVIEKMTPAQKQVYSTVLLTCSMPRKAITACPLAFGETDVKQRIRGILNYRKPSFWVVLISGMLCLTLAVVFLSNPLRTDDYIRLTRAGTKITEPQFYQFDMRMGNDVRGPIVFAEMWQSGELVESKYAPLPEDTEQMGLTMSAIGDGSTVKDYRVEVDTNPYAAALDVTFSMPEETWLANVYSWHGAKDIRLEPDKEVLLAASIFDCGGDGYLLFDFDNEDYAEAGGRLRNLECVVLVYAAFPAKNVYKESSQPFVQEIYQFADELPAGYTMKTLWPYYAGLYKNGNIIGRIASHEIQETDGAPDVQKTLGFTSDYPAERSIVGNDPDWEIKYADGPEHQTHYLHRVSGILYDLQIESTEPDPEIGEIIVPRLRKFLDQHPDAIANTYTYMMQVEEPDIAAIQIAYKDRQSGGVVTDKDGVFTPNSIAWLEPLEGMQSIDGVVIKAINVKGETVWSYTVPYELGTAERIQDGQWVIRRYCPPEEIHAGDDDSVQENDLIKIDTPSDIYNLTKATFIMENQDVRLNSAQMRQLEDILRNAQKQESSRSQFNTILQIVQQDGRYRSISLSDGEFCWGGEYYRYEDTDGLVASILQQESGSINPLSFLNPAQVEYQDNSIIDKLTAGKQMTLEELLTSESWTEQPIPEGVTGPGTIRRGIILRLENGNFMVISYDTDALCIFNLNGDCIGRYTGSYTGEQMVDMLWDWVAARIHTGSAYYAGATLTQVAPNWMLSILMHPTTALNIDGMGAVMPENQEEWIAAWDAVRNSESTISEDAAADTYYGITISYEGTHLNVHHDGTVFSLREMGGERRCYSAKSAQPLIDLLAPILEEFHYSHVKPGDLKDIQYANLWLDGMQYTIPQGDPKLQQLESILTSGKPMGYMPACWFTSLLTVGLPSGATKTVSVATDSCGVYLSNGVCYEFSGDNARLYQAFGVELPAE